MPEKNLRAYKCVLDVFVNVDHTCQKNVFKRIKIFHDERKKQSSLLILMFYHQKPPSLVCFMNRWNAALLMIDAYDWFLRFLIKVHLTLLGMSNDGGFMLLLTPFSKHQPIACNINHHCWILHRIKFHLTTMPIKLRLFGMGSPKLEKLINFQRPSGN